MDAQKYLMNKFGHRFVHIAIKRVNDDVVIARFFVNTNTTGEHLVVEWNESNGNGWLALINGKLGKGAKVIDAKSTDDIGEAAEIFETLFYRMWTRRLWKYYNRSIYRDREKLNQAITIEMQMRSEIRRLRDAQLMASDAMAELPSENDDVDFEKLLKQIL